MINITFYHDTNKKVRQVLMTGHAGYADSGYDIVCAAVSSQVISVENSLVQLLNIDVVTVVNETEGGYLKLTLPPHLSHSVSQDAQLLLKHLSFAFEVLAESYPEFIRIYNKSFKS
ncbi:ribosomal-processing cysteine protease Prp [Aerococcaceae bacterium WGS1372]